MLGLNPTGQRRKRRSTMNSAPPILNTEKTLGKCRRTAMYAFSVFIQFKVTFNFQSPKYLFDICRTFKIIKPSNKNIRIAIRVHEETRKELQEIADAERKTLSEFIRLELERIIKERKKPDKTA